MNASTSGFTGYKETTAEADDTNAGKAKVIVSMSDQIGDKLPSVSMNLFETTAHERETERFQEFLQYLSGNIDDHVESDKFGGPIFGAQHHELFSSQEADQLKRGIRRHLNFGAAIASKHTSHGTHETSNLCFPDSYKDFESFVTPHFEPRGISSIWQARSCAQTATLHSSFFSSECEPVRSAQNCGNRALSSRISSGGGLLLNKFVRSDSVGSDSSISKKLRSNLHQNDKLMSDRDHYLGKGMNSNPILSFSGGIYTRMGGGQQKSQAAVTAGSSNYRSMSIMQTPRDSLHSIPFEQQAILCEWTTPSSENADIIELNQMIPERNREKAKYSTESEGCKRCNCERSRCSKLYWECSVAGNYCLDACSCDNCFNKPEY